jgi:uncharacterized protein YxjI
MKKYIYEGFNDTKYLVRAKVLTIMNAWTIFDSKKNEVFYCKQKFSFKTDIHIYTDKSKVKEVLIAKTDSIIDFSAHYNIIDSETREKIGAVKRKGIKSLLKDEWVIMDKNNIKVGLVKEDNTAMALLRRVLPAWLVPKRYSLFIGETQVGLFKKHRNPFIWKTSIDFSQDIKNLLDRRMGIAIALLLCGIGERKN